MRSHVGRPRRRLAGGLLALSVLVALPLRPAAASALPASSSTATTLPLPSPSATGAASSASVDALSAWRGGIDLYRPGVFSTQKTWYWCTAAVVQIARNIVLHQADHTAASQRAYFDWMRRHDRYLLPLADGTDAVGWTAGFREYVDRRYALVTSSSFSAALRAAVTNLRRTGLPVGLAVDHGNHAWLLTGFTATADPARTAHFTVTSVRVVGPLYGLQSRGGYDMPPDTRLTPKQLQTFFTPWHYRRIRMSWEGTYVSIQPSATPTAKATPTPGRTPTPTPSATAARSPSTSPATSGSAAASPDLSAAASSDLSAAETAIAALSSAGPVASIAAPPDPAVAASADESAPADAAAVAASVPLPILALVLVALVAAAALAVRVVRPRVR